ncbi:hypothetical protein [Xanthobacter sp. 126]|uniref:hypothetical protein n=1 Tax=Xanthobacter sp. 126 TaxID=1131814 RepID=UPI00045E7FF4|nr:hypothetical protein [Xanthobacter sp. 126]
MTKQEMEARLLVLERLALTLSAALVEAEMLPAKDIGQALEMTKRDGDNDAIRFALWLQDNRFAKLLGEAPKGPRSMADIAGDLEFEEKERLRIFRPVR